MSCHAIPGFGGLYSIIWLLKTNTHVKQQHQQKHQFAPCARLDRFMATADIRF
ncbi:hypothetical protein GNIT_0849 [Glaciecola nitratireducens FR1064]|uniref:Uncharacterized protein n=1 Tax=Glaciecola nitratireducens (strain JCM 12485 / KCTC 12276 / FR1064) TaxID=1085623 RepID=G4QJU5_GLANF|nr:hypothetical protein GNIT_0849 [Glaciecola nitratireducens FR1064]